METREQVAQRLGRLVVAVFGDELGEKGGDKVGRHFWESCVRALALGVAGGGEFG